MFTRPRSREFVELESAVRSLQRSVADLTADVCHEREVATSLERRVEQLEERLKFPGETDQDVDSTDCEEGNELEFEFEYKVGESVWDSCAILGLDEVGWASSALLLVSLMLNASVQVYLCYVLLTSPSFSREQYFKDMVPDMRRWRSTLAHSFQELDARESSLVSRVCGDDGALSVADAQTSLLSEINAYLDMEPEDLHHTGLGTGVCLCSACLFLFAVLVLREMRGCAISALAFGALPRSRFTQMHNRAIATISHTRLLVIWAMCTVRAFVAVALLTTGTMWLSSTSSITDLILNAAALGFIMDLDEMLFEAAVPMHVQSFVRKLAPLRAPHPPLNMEAVLPLIASIAVVGSCLSVFVLPNVADMIQVKFALCGGGRDFVVATSPLGFVFSRMTHAFNASVDEQTDTLEQKAVTELIDIGGQIGDKIPQFSVFQMDPSRFFADVASTLGEWAKSTPCRDTDAPEERQSMKGWPGYYMAVRWKSKVHGGLSLAEYAWRCADYIELCDTMDAVRVLCPVTCGCADPLAGSFYIGPQKGCPRACHPLLVERLTNAPCIDLDVVGSHNWTRFWHNYAEFLNVSIRTAVDKTFSDRKIKAGCAAANETDVLTASRFCNRYDPFLASNGLGTILGFCPATCCTGPNPPKDCPRDCKAAEG